MAYKIRIDGESGYINECMCIEGMHIVSVCEMAVYFLKNIESSVKAIITNDISCEREVIYKKDLGKYFKYKIEYDKVCSGTEEGVPYERHYPWVNYANSMEKLESFKYHLNVIGGRAVNIRISKIEDISKEKHLP